MNSIRFRDQVAYCVDLYAHVTDKLCLPAFSISESSLICAAENT